ncbi:DNA replication/repair protein RecF [Candidatus Babeliales bacterium]|nr:DNA replication/repair protein RecF [Candidatus Babeliales bacterium]
MFIQKLRIQQFRCFSDKSFSFQKPIVLLEGGNGSGKTSILEALHYACFFKSFRTNKANDLVSLEKDHFFLQVDFQEANDAQSSVQVGFSAPRGEPQKRLVKFNKKTIKSYKELIEHFRVITLTEDDLQLVQGSPEHRRYFLNQFLVLLDYSFYLHLKKYNQILSQRNKLLRTGLSKSSDKSLFLWSQQLWEQTVLIQKARQEKLAQLEIEVNKILKTSFKSLEVTVAFEYQAKNKTLQRDFETFWKEFRETKGDLEWRLQRSLFGIHIDDFLISFQHKKARHFASRGQQKLIVFLLKIALIQRLEELGIHVSFLLDDFLTDFDHERLTDCLVLLDKITCQIFLTSPLQSLILEHYTGDKDGIQVIKLS